MKYFTRWNLLLQYLYFPMFISAIVLDSLPLYPEAMFSSKAVGLEMLMQCLKPGCNPNREA